MSVNPDSKAKTFAYHSDFTFYGYNNQKYTLYKASEQLTSEYNLHLSLFKAVIGSQKYSDEYFKQMEELSLLDRQSLKIIFIAAISEYPGTLHGYFTDPEDAKMILEKDTFRVKIISPNNELLADKTQIIKKEEIKRIILNYNDRLK